MSNHQSLRENVHQLTGAFVDSLFEALREALVDVMAREVDDARQTLRGAWRGEFAKADAIVNGATGLARKPRRPRQAKAGRAPVASERRLDAPEASSSEFDEGLVLNPELMLAALGAESETAGRASARPSTRARTRTPSALLGDAPEPASDGASEPEAPMGPALREDEVAMQTTSGQVVIRRKRQAA